MSRPEIALSKGRNGWQAKSEVPLVRGDEKGWHLSISTSKHSRGGLVAYASTRRYNDGFVTTRVFRDFHYTADRSDARCTEKSVTLMHTAVLARLPAILQFEAAWEAEQVAKGHTA